MNAHYNGQDNAEGWGTLKVSISFSRAMMLLVMMMVALVEWTNLEHSVAGVGHKQYAPGNYEIEHVGSLARSLPSSSRAL